VAAATTTRARAADTSDTAADWSAGTDGGAAVGVGGVDDGGGAAVAAAADGVGGAGGADRTGGAPGCRTRCRPSRTLRAGATNSAAAGPSAAASRSPVGPGSTWPATGTGTSRSNWSSPAPVALVWRFSPETAQRSLRVRRHEYIVRDAYYYYYYYYYIIDAWALCTLV